MDGLRKPKEIEIGSCCETKFAEFPSVSDKSTPSIPRLGGRLISYPTDHFLNDAFYVPPSVGHGGSIARATIIQVATYYSTETHNTAQIEWANVGHSNCHDSE
ncbi:hypothetical protein WA026_001618 [Henosepilachna vigintioctopunctata]|uniref:Uncharacterized protein n=1 Tax=Henosepilachna vigintioctopunctata TaxID=420089 RepID=A0AAW1UUD9_9CUCU